ncbi:MAG: helix-turn-helix domain-containing protein, partial [Pseudomonadota bacterium]
VGLPGITVRHFTAEAVTKAKLQVLSRASFEALLAERQEVAIAVQELLRSELRMRERHLLRLASLPAEPRLLSFLAELARQSGPDMRTDSGFVTLPMSRREIADHLGLTLETVSRAFTMLRRRGQLELRSKSVFRLPDELQPKAEMRAEHQPVPAQTDMTDALYEGVLARS